MKTLSVAMTVLFLCTAAVAAPPADSLTSEDHTLPQEEVLTIAEVMPAFSGGTLLDFRQWVTGQIIYPTEARKRRIEGDVVVTFVIDREGNLGRINVIASPDPTLADEVIRILKNSPAWSPGRNGTQPVSVMMSLPVMFRIAKPQVVRPREIALIERDGVMRYVETMPVFQDRHFTTFQLWAKQNIRYPDEASDNGVRGQAAIAFVIEKNGKVGRTELLASDHPSFSAEAERVVRSSPRWTPGRQDGKRVPVCLVITLDFPSVTADYRQAAKDGDPQVVADAKGGQGMLVKQPLFNGTGFSGFRQWVAQNITYPTRMRELGVHGTVVCTFIVERDGSVSDIKLVSSPHYELSEEIIGVLRKSPKWTPGYIEKQGKGRKRKLVPARVQYTLPINFEML